MNKLLFVTLDRKIKVLKNVRHKISLFVGSKIAILRKNIAYSKLTMRNIHQKKQHRQTLARQCSTVDKAILKFLTQIRIRADFVY